MLMILICWAVVHTIKENAETLAVASKENGLEVNADKTKYMAMSRDQTAGRSYNINNDNSSIEGAEGFECLGTALTNQNSIFRKKLRAD
jgi:hypothetical protein